MNKIFFNKNLKKIRIDHFIKNQIENLSRNQIQKYIQSGNVIVNDIIIKKNNYIIQFNDKIEIKNLIFFIQKKNQYYENIFENIVAEKIELKIIYEDDDLILLNKPSGILVHPGIGHTNGTIINGIQYYFGSKCCNKLYRNGLIHRLDKDTSGVLILAKNIFSQKFLIKQFLYRTIKREYIAIIWGKLPNKKGTITGFIKRDPKNRKRMINTKDNKNGKYSITHYKVIKNFDKYITYISCKLDTGRTHQIRTQFKYLGYPVFGDPIYNGKNNFFFKKLTNKHKIFFKKCFKLLSRQALHAKKITFIHPNNKKVSFSCPIPNDIKNIINNFNNFFYNNVPCNIE